MKKTLKLVNSFVCLFKKRLPYYAVSSSIVSARNFLLTWLTAYIGSRVIVAVETGSVIDFEKELIRFALILVIYAVADTFGMFLLSVTSQCIENDLRLGLIRGVLLAPFSKTQNLGGRGEFLSRINKDTASAVSLLSGGIVSVAMCAISGIGATVVIARQSILVCLCLYVLGCLGFFIQNTLTKRVKELSAKQRKASARAMSVYLQILSRSADVKMLGKSEFALSKYKSELREFRSLSDRLALVSGVSEGVTGGIGVIGFWGAVGICLYAHAVSGESLDYAVMISQMSSLVLMMAMSLYSFMSNLRGSLVSVERCLELSGLEKEELSGKKLPACVDADHFVQAKNLCCTFENGTSLFYDLTFPKNKLVAVVGESGRGKTTLMRLLLKLYPYSGELLIDGEAVSEISASELRSSIAYVPQDNPAVCGTFRDILCFGIARNLTNEEITKAMKMVGADQWVLASVNGLDSIVTDGGANLSGGQRQMLALARAIMFDRDILILDEAFSGLDDSHVCLICENLKKHCIDKSVFIITHDERVRLLCDVCIEV